MRLPAPPFSLRAALPFSPAPCASVGIQLNTPLCASIAAPSGAPSRLKLRPLAGRSWSVAVAGSEERRVGEEGRSPGSAGHGGKVTSVKWKVVVSASEKLG